MLVGAFSFSQAPYQSCVVSERGCSLIMLLVVSALQLHSVIIGQFFRLKFGIDIVQLGQVFAAKGTFRKNVF